MQSHILVEACKVRKRRNKNFHFSNLGLQPIKKRKEDHSLRHSYVVLYKLLSSRQPVHSPGQLTLNVGCFIFMNDSTLRQLVDHGDHIR